METITLQVEGMTCGGCTASISRALQTKAGVVSVNACLDSGTVAVDIQPGTIDKLGLKAAVEAAGFDVIG